MALINCPECVNEVSEKATTCPHCGYKLENKKGGVSLFVIVLVIIAGLLLIKFATRDMSTTPDKDYYNTVDKWYEGGTLHQAKILDWKYATEKNKLATCGDFMAKVDNTISMAELKKRATELKTCIDEATIKVDITDDFKVAEVAALCIISMGY